jgi:hypothetical protein
MSVSGNLKTMLPGDLLQWLSLGQKSGTLVVRNKAVEKKIFFGNGRVISSASNDPREYLGQFLMSHGYITEPELVKAMEVQSQSRILLGKILVVIGVISEEDLQRLMRLKAEEAIYDIFLWNEGEFEFLDEVPDMEMIPLKVDVTGLIMEGTRRVDEWNRISSLITHEALVPTLLKEVPEEALEDDAERTVVNAIDGRRSLAELVLESRSSSFTVASTVYHLTREGYLQLSDPTMVPLIPPDPLDESAPPAVIDEVSEDDEIMSMISRAQVAMRARDYEKAQRLLKAAENLDPTHSRVRNAIKGAESAILSDLRSQGLHDLKVPRVSKALEEITQMNFTPNEGFILSRINGQWDLGSLIKISPIREPDAMLIFYKLWKDGIIALD